MDVPHRKQDYLTGDSSAWVHGVERCSAGKTVGVMGIRAQDGTFALCSLSMSIKKCVLLYFSFF